MEYYARRSPVAGVTLQIHRDAIARRRQPLHKASSFLGHSDQKITVKAYCSESEP